MKNVEYKKIRDIADIHTGLVLSRKGAKQLELIPQDVSTQISLLKPIEYKVISLRSIDRFGNINLKEVDEFQSIEKLPDKYLTQENDIIIRLFCPIYSCLIKKENKNILIPSQCAVIRLNTSEIIPDFLQFYIMNGNIEQQMAKKEISTQLRSVRTSSIGELEIPIFSLKRQEQISKISELFLKKEQLLFELTKEESLYKKAMLKKILEIKLEI